MNAASRRTKQPAEEYGPEETARRRDEVIRRMANTSPQPRVARKPSRRSKKAKATAVDRPLRARSAKES